MSILIKGMEMPTRCFNCGMCEVDDTQILCRISHGSYVDYRELDEQTAIQDRPSWCPLIEVPKHGDLIDRDALIKDGWLSLHKEVMRMGGYAIHELPLKNPSIPVVIESEE